MRRQLLKFADVELYYDHVYALKGVSLEVNEGETVALIGANGAGKSSILRAITGLRRIRSGEIHLQGTAHRRRQPGCDRQDGHRHGAGGTPRLPLHVRQGQSPDGRVHALRQGRDRRDRWRWCSARFPRLKERYSQAAGTMSGGEQQMLVIGRALMAKPRLLLLDEPSLGIAPKLVQDIARSIVAINRDEKVSVLLVEQNSRMALRISQRAYALTTGKVALSGNSPELLERRPGQASLSRRRDIRRMPMRHTCHQPEHDGLDDREDRRSGAPQPRRRAPGSSPSIPIDGPPSIEGYFDEVFAIPGMIGEMQKASGGERLRHRLLRRYRPRRCALHRRHARWSASAKRRFTWRAWLPANSAS